MVGPGVDKVTEITVNEHKRNIEKSNLDDLNDHVKTFFFTQPTPGSS